MLCAVVYSIFDIIKKLKNRILALHCTYSFPINLFSFFTCYFGYNSTVLSHRPDFWPAAHVVGRKNIYLSINMSGST